MFPSKSVFPSASISQLQSVEPVRRIEYPNQVIPKALSRHDFVGRNRAVLKLDHSSRPQHHVSTMRGLPDLALVMLIAFLPISMPLRFRFTPRVAVACLMMPMVNQDASTMGTNLSTATWTNRTGALGRFNSISSFVQCPKHALSCKGDRFASETRSNYQC